MLPITIVIFVWHEPLASKIVMCAKYKCNWNKDITVKKCSHTRKCMIANEIINDKRLERLLLRIRCETRSR